MDIPEIKDWQISEAVMNAYFPRLSYGLEINGKIYHLKRNNRENIYNIDWAIFCEGGSVKGVIDTESKPGWKPDNGKYPFWSVSRYTWNYNRGNTGHANETVKVQYYRQYPDQSFWMAMRSDNKEAGIIKGRTIIESPIRIRRNPRGFNDMEIFEFPQSEMVFCEILEGAIEMYVIGELAKAEVFNE